MRRMATVGTSWTQRQALVLVTAVITMTLALVVVRPDDARASDYVVTTLTDELVQEGTDGTTTTTVLPSVGTLRRAIIDANANPGVDTVSFAVTGTITLLAALETITEPLTITGPGASALTISGASSFRILDISYAAVSAVPVAISGVTLSGGAAPGAAGGAIRTVESLTVTDARFNGNSALGGGAIASSSGALTITDTSFTSNSSGTDGGGAILLTSGSLTVTRSTFSLNTTTNSGGAVLTLADTTIESSTFFDNDAIGASALMLSSVGGVRTSTLSRSTVTGGASTSSSGAVRAAASQNLSVSGSIVAGNTGGDLTQTGATVTAQYSVLGSVGTTGITATGGNQVLVLDPMLGALADNGGSTQTMLPQAGSPAIDHGDPTWSGTPATDQRGQPRQAPGGGAVDAGSVETPFTVPGLPTTIGSNLTSPATAFGGPDGTPTFTAAQLNLPLERRAAGGLTAPASGVVTQWRVKAGGTGGQLALRILRPSGGGFNATGAGTSAVETALAATTSTFSARLPIQTGDRIGVDWITMRAVFGGSAVLSPQYAVWSPAVADGANTAPTFTNTGFGFEILVNADIEPDADGDGWGDTTQDQCLSELGTDNGCVAAASTPSGDGGPPPASAPEPDVDVDVFNTDGEDGDAHVEVVELDADELGDAGNGVEVMKAYDIEVTNDDTDHARICVPYSDRSIAAFGFDERELELFHLHGGDRDVITTERSPSSNTVCGETRSFSPFAIGVLRTDRVDDDPVAVAAMTSKETFASHADIAYVVGSGTADAMSVGPVAALRNAPLLLTSAGGLSELTRVELERLRPRRVVVVGGTRSVSDAAVAAIAATGSTVTRIAGSDRFATATMLSSIFESPETVYVVGAALGDGVVGGAAAAHDDVPLLLTSRDRLPTIVKGEIARLGPDRIVVVGGRSSVSDAVLAELAALAPEGARRLAGVDRYGTSARVALGAFGAGAPVVAVNGTSSSLAVAVAVAAMKDAALVFVTDAAVPTSVRRALRRIQPASISVVGGRTDVPVQVESDLALLLGRAA